MNRRSILRLLGLTPIAAPAALTAASKPALSPIDYASLVADARFRIDLLADGCSRFVVGADHFYIRNGSSPIPPFSFDGNALTVPSLRIAAPPAV